MIIPRLSQNKDNLRPTDHSKFARSRFIYWNIFYEFWHSPVESCSIQCTPWVRYSHIHSLIYALDVEVWTLSCYPHEKPLKPQQILQSALNLEVLEGQWTLPLESFVPMVFIIRCRIGVYNVRLIYWPICWNIIKLTKQKIKFVACMCFSSITEILKHVHIGLNFVTCPARRLDSLGLATW